MFMHATAAAAVFRHPPRGGRWTAPHEPFIAASFQYLAMGSLEIAARLHDRPPHALAPSRSNQPGGGTRVHPISIAEFASEDGSYAVPPSLRHRKPACGRDWPMAAVLCVRRGQ